MLAHYQQIDKRFAMLAMAIKAWGVQAEIINPPNGYLNTYTIYMMILHYLQSGVSPPILPNLLALQYNIFNGTLDLEKLEKIYDLGIKMDEENSCSVGELLIGFLRYFAYFSFKNDGIFVRLACVDSKKTEDEFFTEEVYDRTTTAKNLTKRKVRFVKTTFIDAYLGQYNGPNFKKFIHADRTFLEMDG
uniref:PAP-associated domain-containing protein n=1 Tax=Panagrolaimus davidi TaxID=227884 RepID=A0A914Q548_9BILA